LRYVALLTSVLTCALTRLVFAQAPAGLPPIALDRCAVTTNWSYLNVRANQRWVTTSGLNIAFHNRSSQTATAVRFLVNYRGDVETIDDVGSFASGVNINHKYPQFVDFAYLGTRPNFCRVVSVKFADGTTWTAPVGRRQAVQP
jgi:hypothetical protein